MVIVNGVRFLISDDLPFGAGLIPQELLCSRIFLKLKGTEKVSDTESRRGMESAPIASTSKGVMDFLVGYYNK